MENDKNSIWEKNLQFWIRTALRFMSWVVLMFYMIWRIIVPVVRETPVYLDKNDGYIILGTIAILLAVEAVRAYVKRKLKSTQ